MVRSSWRVGGGFAGAIAVANLGKLYPAVVRFWKRVRCNELRVGIARPVMIALTCYCGGDPVLPVRTHFIHVSTHD